MERIANFIYDKAKFIILLVVILNIVSAVSFVRFGLDTDFLSFFSGGNPKALEFNELNDKYDSGETITIFIEHDASLLDEENINRIFNLQQELKDIEGISQLQSFLPEQIPAPTGAISVDHAYINDNYEVLRDFIENKYFMKDQVLSSDETKGTIVVMPSASADAGAIVDSLKEIVEAEEDFILSLAGNEVIKDTIWNYLIYVFILMPCAVLVVLLVFFAVLRVRLFTILAFIPAGLAALWTFGTLFWSGQELNLVTILSPMFIIVVGSAFGLHYVSHFLENIHKYLDRRQLTVETLCMVGTPIFLAAITTMAGFASLTWTKVMPMRDMGIFVTLGIGYAGFISLFFIPAVLSKIPLPSKLPEPKESRLAIFVLLASRQRALIVIAFIAIIVVSAIFIPKIEVVSDQLMFFREGTEIRESFAKVDEHFGGAVPLVGEIVAPEGSQTLSDYDYAIAVLATEREMESLPGIKSIFSSFDLAKGVNYMMTGQDDYPQDQQVMMGVAMMSGGMGRWVSDDGVKMIIRTQDFTSDDIDELEAFVDSHENIRLVTGMPLLFDEMNRLVVESQIQSLALALGLIFIMLLITMRRIGAALAGMLPVAITIAAILGLLSLANFNLNIMTANLSAICIGVGVDYSIHVISGIYYFRNQGLDRRRSVDSALSSVSRPVLANALGLAIGMSVLFFSPIRLHTHAAAVMWIAMIVSSMAALLLIPIFYSGGKSAEIEEGAIE